MNIIIRPEMETDHRGVEELTRAAFWNLYTPGCDEHYLVHVMRTHPDFIRSLDLVAEIDGKLAGNIMYTRSFLRSADGEQRETVTFGPVSVHPDHQRKGIGSALIRHTVALVQQQHIPAIIIYGNPSNYVSLGFVGAKRFNISTPDGSYPSAMLVLPLREELLTGRQWTFHESSVFSFDKQEAEAFDAGFPPMVRQHAPSQELFSILSRSTVQ
ncbi:MAG: N-acetyltransferase [Bacteroidetes bacterium]|nr:N-acetyltransferase [Bacteroidota bacterium]